MSSLEPAVFSLKSAASTSKRLPCVLVCGRRCIAVESRSRQWQTCSWWAWNGCAVRCTVWRRVAVVDLKHACVTDVVDTVKD